MRTHIIRTTRLAAAVVIGLMVSAAGAEERAGPKEQFQSVVSVRAVEKKLEIFRQLKPHTLSMFYPEDFYELGGRYMYMWFNPIWISLDDKPGTNDPKTREEWRNNPNAYEEILSLGMWGEWEANRAMGIVTGERPARFEDLCAVSEEYALAKRDGSIGNAANMVDIDAVAPDATQTKAPSQASTGKDGKPLPERFKGTSGRKERILLSLANPDARRLMIDLVKFNAAHLYNNKNKKDRNMLVNGGFIDLDGTSGFYADYSDFARAKFDAWVRASYSPDQVKAILGVEPGQPIPILAPKDMPAEFQQRNRRLYWEWYWNVLAPEHCRALKEAIDSVLKPEQFHFTYHGDGYEWRVVGGYQTNMIVWGDWLQSYCTECGRTPCVRRGDRFYAAPAFVSERVVSPYANASIGIFNCNNVYDYQYGAGRLWGEPVQVKTGFRGPHPAFHTRAITELGMAEALALLGNMRIGPSMRKETGKQDTKGHRFDLILPIVEFAHSITPQIRQMIPAARVGVVFSPADSYMFRGFERPSNDTQAHQVSNLCHRQHVPLQVAHLQILEQTLAQRPMDVLIVPWLRMLKDAQAAVIARFVQEGGSAIFIGECGTMTWEGLKREQNAFADLLPAPEGDKVTYKQVGKGRSAFIPGALTANLASNQDLQRALFESLGRTPSCVSPDRYPLLLTNLTRNSDDSRFWLHLVNFDVEHGKEDADKPVRPVGAFRALIPLPDGLKGKQARLYRPDAAETALAVENGKEGCAVIVPGVEIYALVAVETERGERPAKPLCEPETLDDALRAVAKGFDAPAAIRALVSRPGEPPATGKRAPRVFAGGDRADRIAYAAAIGDQPVQLRIDGKIAPDLCVVYASDGKRILLQATGTDKETVLSLPALPPGGHYFLRLPEGRQMFTHSGGACFEASLNAPLTLNEPGDSEPLYFLVPKACRTFKVYLNSRLPLHLVVKDGAEEVRLDRTGVFEGGDAWGGWGTNKVFDVQVPEEQSGRAWSVWLLNAKNEKGVKGLTQFALEGVPPVVAQSPSQLLIAKGDE